jgi:predicted RNA methylase
MENIKNLKTDLLLEYLNTGSVDAFNFLNNLGDVSIPHFHYPMLKDEGRNKFYETFLSENAHEKIILDVGAGAGYLVALGLKYGAKKVYAVENNWAMSAILQHVFKTEIFNKRVIVISKDALTLERNDFDEMPQLIIQELFSDNGVSEGVLNIFSHLRQSQILGNAMVFPSLIKIYAQVIAFADEADHFLKPLDSIFVKAIRYDDGIKWIPRGESVCVLETDISQYEKKIIKKINLDLPQNGTGIRFWFECSDTSGKQILSNDVSKHDCHWANLVYPIPKLLLGKNRDLQITFERNNFKLFFSNNSVENINS